MRNNSSEIAKMNTWCNMNNMMCMCMCFCSIIQKMAVE